MVGSKIPAFIIDSSNLSLLPLSFSWSVLAKGSLTLLIFSKNHVFSYWISFSFFSSFLFQFSTIESHSHVRLFETPWTRARQASLAIINCWSLPKPMSIELVMPSNHLTSVVPFSSCPQSFPASGSFQMSQLFSSGGQSIGVSVLTSVLPINT